MSFNAKLNRVANWAAVLSSVAVMQVTSLADQQVQEKEPAPSVEGSTVEQLERRVERGTIINGETLAERSARWKAFKAKNGTKATLEAIEQEKIEKIEIPHKDEQGYTFEVYEPGKKRSLVSYYPNGVLRFKTGENAEEAEGYYPDGSKKFVRTADGVETKYHPGGEKGKEKIEETPHELYGAYDVLDEEGRRLEHHYDVAQSSPHHDGEGGTHIMRDVKKVDLYDPQTQQVVGTYTLDNWDVSEGRVASIGFVDDTGVMKTMKFPQTPKNSGSNHYADSLSLDQIKEIYHEEQKERLSKQREITDLSPQR